MSSLSLPAFPSCVRSRGTSERSAAARLPTRLGRRCDEWTGGGSRYGAKLPSRSPPRHLDRSKRGTPSGLRAQPFITSASRSGVGRSRRRCGTSPFASSTPWVASPGKMASRFGQGLTRSASRVRRPAGFASFAGTSTTASSPPRHGSGRGPTRRAGGRAPRSAGSPLVPVLVEVDLHVARAHPREPPLDPGDAPAGTRGRSARIASSGSARAGRGRTRRSSGRCAPGSRCRAREPRARPAGRAAAGARRPGRGRANAVNRA